ISVTRPRFDGGGTEALGRPRQPCPNHSAAIRRSVAYGSASICTPADLVPQQTYQEPNRNCSISKLSVTAARSCHGLINGFPSMVGRLHQRPNGRVKFLPLPER